jgi:HK97 family phage major capsid protein
MSKNIRTLQAKKAATVEAARALLAAAGDNDLTAEQQTQYDAAMATVASLNARIDRETQLAAEEAATDRVVAIRDDAVISTRDNREDDSKHGFKSFGQYAQAVIAAGMGTGRPDERLFIGAAAPTTTANEASGADGGWMVPPDYSRELFRMSLMDDALLPYTANVNVESNSMVFPKTEQTPWGTNGVRAYWQAEAVAGTQTKPVLGTQALRLHKLLALTPLTDELVADTNALEGLVPPDRRQHPLEDERGDPERQRQRPAARRAASSAPDGRAEPRTPAKRPTP